MEYGVAVQVMQDYILSRQRKDLPSTLSMAQLDEFDIDRLHAVFSAMSKQARQK